MNEYSDPSDTLAIFSNLAGMRRKRQHMNFKHIPQENRKCVLYRMNHHYSDDVNLKISSAEQLVNFFTGYNDNRNSWHLTYTFKWSSYIIISCINNALIITFRLLHYNDINGNIFFSIVWTSYLEFSSFITVEH